MIPQSDPSFQKACTHLLRFCTESYSKVTKNKSRMPFYMQKKKTNPTATYYKLFHSLPCCGHKFQVTCKILMLTHVYCFYLSWWVGFCVLALCDLKDEDPEGKHNLWVKYVKNGGVKKTNQKTKIFYVLNAPKYINTNKWLENRRNVMQVQSIKDIY